MFSLSIINTIINVNKSQENTVNNIALVQGQSHTHTISVTGYALMLDINTLLLVKLSIIVVYYTIIHVHISTTCNTILLIRSQTMYYDH